MALDVRKLRYFAEVARTGVMAHAAQSVGVAQSALSHHMTELEAQLGVRLLERRPRGVALTPAGERLFQHAGAILSALDRAESDVRNLTERPSGRFALGLCHTATEIVALPAMQRVVSDLPDVHLTVVTGVSGSLTAQLLRGELNMALAYYPPNDSRFVTEAVLDEHLYVVGRPDIIGASPDPIRYDDIPVDSLLAHSLAREARMPPVRPDPKVPAHPQLNIEGLQVLCSAMNAGLGCAILARATVMAALRSGQLHARQIVQPEMTRLLHLVTLSNQPMRRVDQEMRVLMLELLGNAVRDQHWPGKLIAQPLSRQHQAKPWVLTSPQG